MSLIDTACVGQVGPLQLAALGPNVTIFNFVFQVFSFLGAASCNMMAANSFSTSDRLQNERNFTKASMQASHTLIVAVVIGILSSLTMLTLGPWLLALMGTTSQFSVPALSYLNIRALSAPAVMIMVVCQGMCLGQQDTSTPLLIYALCAAINLAGDYFLTLRAGWGVAGAAWATLSAQIIGAFCFLLSLRTSAGHGADDSPSRQQALTAVSQPTRCGWGWYGLPTRASLQPLVDLGIPLVLRCVLGMVTYTLLARAAAHIGMLQLAAHQVAMQLFWTLSFVPEPLAWAAQSLIARDIRKDTARARDVAGHLVLIAIAIGVLLGLCVALVSYCGPHLLTSDHSVQTLVQSVAPQSIVSQLLCSVTIAFDGIAIGSGESSYLVAVQLVNAVVVFASLLASHCLHWGLQGVWWSMTLFFAVRLLSHLLRALLHPTTFVRSGLWLPA